LNGGRWGRGRAEVVGPTAEGSAEARWSSSNIEAKGRQVLTEADDDQMERMRESLCGGPVLGCQMASNFLEHSEVLSLCLRNSSMYLSSLLRNNLSPRATSIPGVPAKRVNSEALA